MTKNQSILAALLLSTALMPVAQAQTDPLQTAPASEDSRIEALENRVRQLEKMNQDLLAAFEAMQNSAGKDLAVADETPLKVSFSEETHHHSGAQNGQKSSIGLSSETSFAVLDHAEHTNIKILKQLQARSEGKLADTVTLGGGVTAIATAQRSNRESKFGYLMRNPTSANQIGRDVSEAVVHSAQLSVTANLTDQLTGYVEMLYNPEQSFGSGTITNLNRNQVQVRRAYVTLGDLDRSPVYAAIGKMDVPFGLNDTVNPFTNSTNWHSFSALAYGAQAGYVREGLHARIMAVQGGAQFRAANVPVQGTSVPSRLNNFALDVNYTTELSPTLELMGGASYIHGSPYCQDYPIFHFNPCQENVPAYSLYTRVNLSDFEFIGEFAETTKVWPGTAVPDPTNPLSQFEAVESRAWTVGGRYGLDTPWSENETLISLEVSKFRAGDEGAPWERQNQIVAGLSHYLTPSVNLFGEYVHVDGFAPLNFLTGGNFPDGSTWSEKDAKTDALIVGLQTAF